MEKPIITAIPGSLELVITHKFDAPRDLVYRVYNDPKLLPDWWGPRRLTTTVERMELRPGGNWRYVQRDEDGNIFAFHGVYHSFDSNKQIISTFEWEGMPGHVILVTTNFEEKDGRTIITQNEVFQSVEDRDGMIQQGMEEGIIEGDERFNELLDKVKTGKVETPLEQVEDRTGCINITRIFDAPREKVWEKWTEPIQYKCWWGPTDFISPYANLDVRKGGKFLVSMRGPDGKEYWDTGTYDEVKPLSHLAYSDTFADEHGNPVPASYYGVGPDKKMEMEVEISLEDLGDRTRLTLEQCGLPEGEMLDNARIGWNQSLDKLADCLR
jgi:uncharacterized protein YndB with AHSA1/START domain